MPTIADLFLPSIPGALRFTLKPQPMRYILTIFLLSFSIFGYSQKNNDSTEIIHVLKEDYKTMVTYDINKHKSYCTEDLFPYRKW